MIEVIKKQSWSLIAPAFFVAAGSDLHGFTVISNSGKPAYWENSTNINYQFHNIPEGFKKPIRSSFDVWASIEGTNLSFSFDAGGAVQPTSRDGINSVSWVTSGWGELSFRPPSRALAVTLSSFDASSGVIRDADIYFNSENFDWAVVSGPEDDGFIDVQNIATHEIGHLIGLDHSSENFVESDPELLEATMYYASSAGETSRRTTKTNDENGARGLYPSSATSQPSISAIEVLENNGSYVVYRVAGENFTESTSFILSHNSAAVFDQVARYRQLNSSSEYEVQFSISSFPSGESSLIAFNDPRALSTYIIDVDSSSLISSSSSSGGGGCQLARGYSSVGGVWCFIVAMLLMFWLRQSFVSQKSRVWPQ